METSFEAREHCSNISTAEREALYRGSYVLQFQMMHADECVNDWICRQKIRWILSNEEYIII